MCSVIVIVASDRGFMPQNRYRWDCSQSYIFCLEQCDKISQPIRSLFTCDVNPKAHVFPVSISGAYSSSSLLSATAGYIYAIRGQPSVYTAYTSVHLLYISVFPRNPVPRERSEGYKYRLHKYRHSLIIHKVRHCTKVSTVSWGMELRLPVGVASCAFNF